MSLFEEQAITKAVMAIDALFAAKEDISTEDIATAVVRAIEHDRLHDEYVLARDRGDHLVYEREWQAFDAWQRSQ